MKVNTKILKMITEESKKNKVLQDFNKADFENTKDLIYCTLWNERNYLIYGGTGEKFDYTKQSANFWSSYTEKSAEFERIFAFAFTSSSNFPAFWICNTTTKYRFSKDIVLNLVALTLAEDAKTVLFVFEDEKENNYFISLAQIYILKDKIEYLTRIEEVNNFYSRINKCLPGVEKVLNNYTGKQIGQKRQEEINTAIKWIAKENNINYCYFSFGYTCYVEFFEKFNKHKKTLFLTSEEYKQGQFTKKIHFDLLKVCDPVQDFERLIKIEEKANKTKSELKKLIDEFNENNNYNGFIADLTTTFSKFGTV